MISLATPAGECSLEMSLLTRRVSTRRTSTVSIDRLDYRNQRFVAGVHPFYMVMEANGQAHGVLILNSNAQEVSHTFWEKIWKTSRWPQFLLPDTSIERSEEFSISTSSLVRNDARMTHTVHLFNPTNPSPLQVPVRPKSFVSTQPSSVVPCSLPIGHSDTKYSHPPIPLSYLSLQLCRYGYKSLQDMKDRVDAVRNYQIPFDVAYADIDYMERYKDFTVGVRILFFERTQSSTHISER